MELFLYIACILFVIIYGEIKTPASMPIITKSTSVGKERGINPVFVKKKRIPIAILPNIYISSKNIRNEAKGACVAHDIIDGIIAPIMPVPKNH